MEFLCSFLRRHLAGEPVVVSPSVRCFLRLPYKVIRIPEFEKFLHVESGAMGFGISSSDSVSR